MIDFYETLQSDYRRCVIDINVKTYFKMKVDKFDDNSIIKLDPRRLSHVEKFKRKLENLLETMNLEDSIETIIKQGVTHEYLDRIDQEITYVFQTAMKNSEGLKRTVPFSLEKVKHLVIISYQRLRLRKEKGECVNTGIMNKKRENAKLIPDYSLTIEKIKLKTHESVE